jgi:hypothetical protein
MGCTGYNCCGTWIWAGSFNYIVYTTNLTGTANTNWTGYVTGTSNNGTNWVGAALASNGAGTVVKFAGANYNTFGGGVPTTNMAYSTNHGVSWTGVGNGNAPSATVAAGDGLIWVSSLSLFVVIGFQYGTTTARLLTSPDGITWTSRTLPTQLSGNKLCYITNNFGTGGGLIVVDTAGNIATSTNATTWTYAGTNTAVGNIIYLSSTGLYYGSGTYSTDLVNWNTLPRKSGYGGYTGFLQVSDGTRIYNATSNSVYNPLPYNTSTQFIVPDFGQNALGSSPAYGAYYYIKT